MFDHLSITNAAEGNGVCSSFLCVVPVVTLHFCFCFVEDFINPVAQLPNSRMATQRRQSVSVKESVLSYVL